jgi:hypothetical protein
MTRASLYAGALLVLAVHVFGQTASVQVRGPRAITVSAAELATMPRSAVTVSSRGQQTTYEGVSIRELLTRVGVPSGEALRGRELSNVVVVTGADGYRVAFGVAEFDPGFTDRLSILADKRNGASLAGNEAPFELILSGEKRPARWVRQVISIEIQAVGG